MSHRYRDPNRCPSCGAPAEADCIDNHGVPYKGCSRGCRIVLPETPDVPSNLVRR